MVTEKSKRGITPAGVHIFRHTAAKLRCDAGETVEDVSRFLDHSSLAVASKLLSIIQAEEHQRHAKKCKIISSSSLVFGLLSKRELEVMQLIEKGFSDRQIADKLVISLSTAKTHVHHIFAKLNAKDRLQAVNRAKDLQLK